MRNMKPAWVAAMAVGAAIGTAGGLPAAPAGGGHQAHAHPTEGPHRGMLIELGKEDYHAELVHDDASDTVTVYILDAAAAKTVAIPAKQVTLNMRLAGKPQQFALAAARQDDDPEGASSAFVARNKTLCQALDAHGATGRLNVEIGGKVYAGKLAGHTHAHPH